MAMNPYPQRLQSVVVGQLLKCDAFAELGHCGRNRRSVLARKKRRELSTGSFVGAKICSSFERQRRY
jgi:hypothetical protein